MRHSLVLAARERPRPLSNEFNGNAAGFSFGRNSVRGESCGAELACERRRASAISDNFYFFRAFVDVLEIAIVDALFAQLREEEHCQRSIQIAERRSPVAIFEHHALRETGCCIVVAQPGE